MKNYQYNGIIKYSAAGFILGVTLIIIGALLNYHNGFPGPWFHIFEYDADFVIIAFSPLYLSLLFGFIGIRREQLEVFTREIRYSLSKERIINSAADHQLKLLAKVVAQVNEGIIISDGHGMVQWINDGFTNITGFKLGDITGKEQGSILYGPLTDADVAKGMREKLAGGEAVVGELLCYHKNGSTFWLSVSIKPIFNDTGEVINFIAIQNDITAAKLSALALKKSEEEKAVVLNNTQAIICLHDMEGVILNINQAAEKMSGFNKKEVTGRSLRLIISEEFHAEFDKYIETINHNETASGTFQIITRTGAKRVWLYQNTVYDNGGNKPYVIASAIDITESVKARNEIERQQQFIRQIIDNSPNVIFMVNEQRQIVLSNQTFSKYYPHQETGFPFAGSLSKGTNDIFLGGVDHIFQMEEGEMIQIEGSMKNPITDSTSWFNIIHKCFKEKNGKKYILGFGMDITERHQVETDLKAANEMVEKSLKVKEQFISNMSHEIRTPLNAVIGFTDLLADTVLNEEQAGYVDIVKTASANLLALINNILDLSKIESGSLALECLPIDINRIINDVVKILEPRAKAKGIAVRTNIDDALPARVKGDQLRLTQVMFNLLGNAVKFTDTGAIDIDCKEVIGPDTSKVYVAFSIKDTGIGVPADKQRDVFERFTQANTDTQRLYGGTGLGLNITRSIIDLYHGTLTMESEQGKGTTFRFILPFIKYTEPQHLSVVKSVDFNQVLSVTTGNPIHILLAEDNLINAMLATQVLTRKGFTLVHVVNGELAVEAIQRQSFDLVLMDIQMPVMNGLNASLAIRRLQGDVSKVPIIAMTAHSLRVEMQHCFEAGMDGYVAKPFKPEDLFNTIIEAVRKKDNVDPGPVVINEAK